MVKQVARLYWYFIAVHFKRMLLTSSLQNRALASVLELWFERLVSLLARKCRNRFASTNDRTKELCSDLTASLAIAKDYASKRTATL